MLKVWLPSFCCWSKDIQLRNTEVTLNPASQDLGQAC